MDKGNILESWKEIAAHLNRNIRTCQLWERELGLPIHRLDGSPKARVFAYPAELDKWLHEKLHERDPKTRPNGKKGQATLPTLPRWNIGLIAGLAALAIAAIGTSAWLLDRQAKVRWANDVAIPEIERLLSTPEREAVFCLFNKVERLIPHGPRLATLRPLVTSAVSFTTRPVRAEIWIKDYAADAKARGRKDESAPIRLVREPSRRNGTAGIDGLVGSPGPGARSWRDLGASPVTAKHVRAGACLWKAEKLGYERAAGMASILAGASTKLRISLIKKS
jgi:hypothetical protein